MSQVVVRRRPRTFLIYGVAAALIALWGAGLWALGVAGQDEGRVLIGAVAAVVLAAAMMRDPFGMLCLIVASLPFSMGVLQFEVGIVTLNPYTLGITAAGLVAIIGCAMGAFRFRGGAEDVVIALLGASFLLSTLRAPDIVEAGYLAFHGVFIPIATYFAVKTLIRTTEEYHKVLVSFVAGATGFALYGLVQFLQNPQRLFVLDLPPISAAALMTAALIVVIYFDWWRRPLGLVSAFALFAGLLATFSRGYLVLLLLTPLFFRMFRRGHATKAMVGMLAASLVGTLLLVQSYEMFQVRVAEQEQKQEQTAQRITEVEFWMSSLYGRARYYALGLEEFAKSPIIGNGFHKGFASRDGAAVVWHNFHVEWLEYGGIAAYLLYAAVFILHFRGVARAARYQPAFAVNLTVLFTILVNGLTNSFTAGISPTLGFLFMALDRALRAQAPGEKPA